MHYVYTAQVKMFNNEAIVLTANSYRSIAQKLHISGQTLLNLLNGKESRLPSFVDIKVTRAEVGKHIKVC